MVTLEDYSQRASFPYLQGSYLAVNALADAYLVVDGPNCVFFKAEHLFGAHDLASSLLDVGGLHRIIHTDVNVDAVITGHEALVGSQLRAVGRHERVGGLFLTALPMAALTGIDYPELAERIGVETGRKIYALRARSLELDWLDGYADFLATLAAEIPLPARRPDPTKLAIVGHFMDRNEGDGLGNLAELERLCRALGLELVSVWLGGQRVGELERVAEAGTVVSLPHGREAARILADRLGATLVRAPLPFGVDATSAFVRCVAESTGRAAAAARFCDESVAAIGRHWRWLVPRRLLHRGIAFFGDPHLAAGLVELAGFVGMRVTLLAACSRRREIDSWQTVPAGTVATSDISSEATASASSAIVWEPRVAALARLLGAVAAETDVLVSNYWGLRWAAERCPTVKQLELGFPSRGYHRCRPAPWLGYEGALELGDRLANALGDRCEYL
jgi:nitrogenase molybdenum-iron protein alpha/beta subunit